MNFTTVIANQSLKLVNKKGLNISIFLDNAPLKTPLIFVCETPSPFVGNIITPLPQFHGPQKNMVTKQSKITLVP